MEKFFEANTFSGNKYEEVVMKIRVVRNNRIPEGRDLFIFVLRLCHCNSVGNFVGSIHARIDTSHAVSTTEM